MHEEYADHGVYFRFPGHWELTEDRTDDELFLTVSSPETSFWSLTLLYGRPDPQQVLQSAIDDFQSEYDEVDVYPAQDKTAACPGPACDIEFFCYELTNSAFLRTCRTAQFTALVLSQGTDTELEETRGDLEGITNSLEFRGTESSEF